MVKRVKIVIPFNYNENWIGGTYYIINLIKAINLIEDSKKPELIIFHKKDEKLDLFKNINYPYIKFEAFKTWRDINRLQRAINKFSRKIFNKNIFEFRPKNKSIDILFPANDNMYFDLISDKQKLFWIPDFQEHFLLEFFTKEEVKARKKYQKNIVLRSVNVIFSSYNALNHFNKIYPENKNNKYVVQFAVLPDKEYKSIQISTLRKKYALPKDFFICSNQFWAHKNHITVLKAAKLLKQKNVKFHIVFTGNTKDYRNPNFYQSLLDFIESEQLHDYVSFLGFIDRNEQLKLMSEAIAVIQPSLFEGWGTVVEDAKAMNKFIILSDIDVHKEQCKENVRFFEAKNENQLSNILSDFVNSKPVIKRLDYKKNQQQFADKFMEAVKKAVSQS